MARRHIWRRSIYRGLGGKPSVADANKLVHQLHRGISRQLDYKQAFQFPKMVPTTFAPKFYKARSVFPTANNMNPKVYAGQ